MRVLHLFVSLPVGGAENLLLSILGRLNPERYESVVCTLGPGGALAPAVRAMGIPLVELDLMRRGGIRGDLVRTLAELIRREQIDLVHCNLFHANLYGRLAAFKVGIPAIIAIHNTYPRVKWHRRLLNWWLARKTAAIIVGSEDIRRDVLRFDGVDPALVHVVPNSVDLSRSESALSRAEARRRLDIPDGATVLGTVGRLEEQKGHAVLLEAMALLRAQGTETRLLLVGSGREEENLRAAAQRLDMAEQVHFLGTRGDLGDLFRAMDLFVMPSRWEGLSLAMLSAMAAELPVVATDVGGVRAVIGDDERGYVVPPGEPQALAAGIAGALAAPGEAAAKARAGADFIRENYSDVAMVRCIESIYERALA